MDLELKKAITTQLEKNKEVDFSYNYVHKGTESKFNINDEYHEALSDWVHIKLNNLLISENVFDDYSGEFKIEKKRLFLFLCFYGPNYMASSIDLSFNKNNLPKSILTKLSTHVNEIDPECFNFDFEYDGNEISNFEFIYYDEDEFSNEDFNEKEINEFKKKIISEIYKNTPCLSSDNLIDSNEFKHIDSSIFCHCSYDKGLDYELSSLFKIDLDNLEFEEEECGMIINDTNFYEFMSLLEEHKHDKIWFIGSLKKKNLNFFEVKFDKYIVGGGFWFEDDGVLDYSFIIKSNYRRINLGGTLINKIERESIKPIKFICSKRNKNALIFFNNTLNSKYKKIETASNYYWINI